MYEHQAPLALFLKFSIPFFILLGEDSWEHWIQDWVLRSVLRSVEGRLCVNKALTGWNFRHTIRLKVVFPDKIYAQIDLLHYSYLNTLWCKWDQIHTEWFHFPLGMALTDIRIYLFEWSVFSHIAFFNFQGFHCFFFGCFIGAARKV